MTRNYDVIIIGVGTMGAATCYQLASRGMKVLGIEQFTVPNNMGSSHGESRAIRMAYYEHPSYVPLLQRTYELWRQLEFESNQVLLHITGGLYIGDPNSELVSGSLRSARTHKLPHEELSRSQIAARFPQFELSDDFSAMYEEQAGVLRPELAIAAMAILATSRGAEIHEKETLLAWSADDINAEVTTTHGKYHAKKLIFCGGAWTGKIIAELNIPLRVTRQVTGFVHPPHQTRFEIGEFPTWALSDADGSIYYGMPILPSQSGMKIAQHELGQEMNPQSDNRDSSKVDVAQLQSFLNRCIPTAGTNISPMRACMYTSTPDGHFVVDRHPEKAAVYFACGFSGHGFKFASVIGEALADLVEIGKTNLPIDFLSLSRF